MVLNIEEMIQKLQTYNNSSYPILSVYLEIPRNTKNVSQKLRQQFRHMTNRFMSSTEVSLQQSDLTYIDAYLDAYHYKGEHKGLAIFSGSNKLWEVITTPDSLPNTLIKRHSPNLKPLMRILTKYRRYLVVLADRQKARYFTLHMGQLEAQGGVDDPSVPHKARHRRGTRELDGKIDRHIQDHLHRHFVFIGQKVHDFVKQKPITGVIIGGHKELMRNLREHLPEDLQNKIVGEFISELNTSMNDVLTRSKTVIEQVNQRLNQQQLLTPA